MKRKVWPLVPALFAIGALTTFLFAQTPQGTTTGKVGDAMALLKDGQPQQAQELIATIPQGDPEYPAAQCCQALCLYELKDNLGFLNVMKSPVIMEAVIAPAIREELDYKHIKALFQYRQFEEVLPAIKRYQTGNTNSAELRAVAEYELAALFERGMKKTTEACRSKDTNVFNKRWPEGKANLETFLARSRAFTGTNYSQLPNRIYQEDIWMARVTLGEGENVLGEIPTNNISVRERVSFLRVQLYFKLQPEQLERNAELMDGFLREFPDSKHQRRVEFDVAVVHFRLGEALCRAAEAAEATNDSTGALQKWANARRHFELQRELQRRAVVDKDSNIEPSDIRDMKEDMLYGLLLEKDYVGLSAQTSAIIAESTKGDMDWLTAKLLAGMSFMMRKQPEVTNAAPIFDEILAVDFSGKPDHDSLMMVAAKWRVHVALRTRDKEKTKQLIEWVRDSHCTKNMKEDFLKDHTRAAEWASKLDGEMKN